MLLIVFTFVTIIITLVIDYSFVCQQIGLVTVKQCYV